MPRPRQRCGEDRVQRHHVGENGNRTRPQLAVQRGRKEPAAAELRLGTEEPDAAVVRQDASGGLGREHDNLVDALGESADHRHRGSEQRILGVDLLRGKDEAH